MKVLMLGWELPPHNSGGLGIACYQLCQAMAKRQVDIEFILPYSAQHHTPFMTVRASHPQGVAAIQRAGTAYDSAKYTFTDGHEDWLDIFSQQLLYEHAVDTMSLEESYDVVHAHDWLTFRAGLRVRERLGTPLVVHLHSVESDRAGREGGGNPMVREIEDMAVHLADRVIAVSQHTKRAIHREYGLPLEAIDVVHNSIDRSALQPLGGDNVYGYLAAMRRHGYKVVVNVGRLTIQKGLPNLLRAAQQVVRHQPKTLFLIVGDGEQYRELLSLAGELGIAKNIIFAGFQRGKAWRDAYAIGDLFVMPSVSEPFGLTPLEAIHYGTPSLISRQSGVGELLRNCLKVDFWDIDEMANQIVSVIRSDALRDELAANMRREYQQLSWDDSVDKVLAAYERSRQRIAV